jgi:hypothetical protein
VIAANLKCVLAASMGVGGRTLIVVADDERMTVALAVDSVLSEAISSLSAVLDNGPIAVVATLLKAAGVAAVVLDCGALHMAATD